MIQISTHFPRYTEFDPQVPVWCVTPKTGRTIHRFFDTSPFSPSGRYLALFRFPQEEQLPQPGEHGEIILVDLHTGAERVVAETCGWEPQMGANINWGASDHELFFNDVDWQTWTPFAWKLDPLSGARQKMEGTVYHASPDGRRLISANMATMRKTQPGYGVRIPDEYVRRNVGPADDDGFYLTDTSSGQCRLLISIREILERADPPVLMPDPEAVEIYGFHSKFNPQSNRLMLSLRWFPAHDEPRWNLFKEAHDEVRFAWVTMPLDKREIYCAIGPEQWEKRGHHATWYPDGEQISMNLNIDRQGMRFVRATYDGRELEKILADTLGSGHPTVHPNGKHILTDTYAHESLAYDDGTTPLRWIDIETQTEQQIARIPTRTPQQSQNSVLRVDPHPAWNAAHEWIAFNAFWQGTRRVFVADMRGLL